MAANTITRTSLRRLADVRPERGRVLSVFLNLDPAEFATPAARSTAITSVLTQAAHRVEEADGLEHDEREALKAGRRARARGADVRRHREQRHARRRRLRMRPGRPARGRAAAPPGRLSPSCSIAPRTSSRWSPTPRRSAGASCSSTAATRASSSPPAARWTETDRVEDDVHSQHDQGGWSQARYQRGVEKEKDDHLVHVAEVAFDRYKQERVRPAARRRARRAGAASSSRSCTRTCASGSPAACTSTSRTPAIEDVRRAAEDGDRGLAAPRASARRSTGSSRASGAAARAPAGIAAVLQALNEARVEMLLLADGFARAGRPRSGHRHALRRRRGPGRAGARALRERHRARRREGDRAVGEGDQGSPPRRSRPARRDRRGAARTDARSRCSAPARWAPGWRATCCRPATRCARGTARASAPSRWRPTARRCTTRPPRRSRGRRAGDDARRRRRRRGRRRRTVARRRPVGADEHGRGAGDGRAGRPRAGHVRGRAGARLEAAAPRAAS